jgi:hypothetical protein
MFHDGLRQFHRMVRELLEGFFPVPLGADWCSRYVAHPCRPLLDELPKLPHHVFVFNSSIHSLQYVLYENILNKI